MVRAILTDPEARDCSWIENTTTGKLKQPFHGSYCFVIRHRNHLEVMTAVPLELGPDDGL